MARFIKIGSRLCNLANVLTIERIEMTRYNKCSRNRKNPYGIRFDYGQVDVYGSFTWGCGNIRNEDIFSDFWYPSKDVREKHFKALQDALVKPEDIDIITY
jgi:hypothetical protein